MGLWLLFRKTFLGLWCIALVVVFFAWKRIVDVYTKILESTYKGKRESTEHKRVVIVGGGFAGTVVAQKLERDFDVVVIDNKDYFEFTPSILRTIVEPSHMKKVQVLHSHYLHRAKIIHKQALLVTPQHVIAGDMRGVDEEKIPYDFLVVSTGSYYNKPFKESSLVVSPLAVRSPVIESSSPEPSSPIVDHRDTKPDPADPPSVQIDVEPAKQHVSNVVISTRASTLRDNGLRLMRKETHTVLVIGGGIVGVELAAEITEKFPGKEVILIHSGPKLIPRMAKKASNYAEWFLSSHGVTLVFDERVTELLNTHSPEDKYPRSVARTSKGRDIKCDMIFLCTGIVPNSALLRPHFQSVLNAQGFVKTNKFLQMEGYWNIFVLGDLADIQEEKLAQSAEIHGRIVANNIHKLATPSVVSSGNTKGFSTYSPSNYRPILVSLGKCTGIFCMGSFTWCGYLPALLKEAVEWKTMVRYR
jgi:NADH dehydrogenase FAD-containing subunit